MSVGWFLCHPERSRGAAGIVVAGWRSLDSARDDMGRANPDISDMGRANPDFSDMGRAQPDISNIGRAKPDISDRGRANPDVSDIGRAKPDISDMGRCQLGHFYLVRGGHHRWGPTRRRSK
jgi:hypothetical protein